MIMFPIYIDSCGCHDLLTAYVAFKKMTKIDLKDGIAWKNFVHRELHIMERIEEERPNSFLEYFIFYFQQRILFICDLKIVNMYY